MTTYRDVGLSGHVQRAAHRHPVAIGVARLGWVAKGVVYGLVGALAVPIAIQGLEEDRAGSGDAEASQLGAVTEIAQTSFGATLLWIVAIGLALYVLWRLATIVLPAENSAETWLTRAGYLVSAVTYAFLAWSAVSFATAGATASGGETEDAKVERFMSGVMEWSAGRWLVGTIGIAIVGVGVYFVFKGLRATFRDDLEPAGVGPVSYESIIALGRVGWVGRGIVMGVVGWFLIRAAIRFRAAEAQGFDGSLREVTESTIGPFVVGFVAVALVVYGLFYVISAPRQRLTGAD